MIGWHGHKRHMLACFGTEMIDLLLGVYNYLIKPRLWDLNGHHVSSKEWKRDRTQSWQTPWGPGEARDYSGVCFPQAARAHPKSLPLGHVIPPSPDWKEVNYQPSSWCADGSGIDYIFMKGMKLMSCFEQEATYLIQLFLQNTHTHTRACSHSQRTCVGCLLYAYIVLGPRRIKCSSPIQRHHLGLGKWDDGCVMVTKCPLTLDVGRPGSGMQLDFALQISF